MLCWFWAWNKQVWKSVNIWRSQGVKTKCASFWGRPVCVAHCRFPSKDNQAWNANRRTVCLRFWCGKRFGFKSGNLTRMMLSIADFTLDECAQERRRSVDATRAYTVTVPTRTTVVSPMSPAFHQRIAFSVRYQKCAPSSDSGTKVSLSLVHISATIILSPGRFLKAHTV